VRLETLFLPRDGLRAHPVQRSGERAQGHTRSIVKRLLALQYGEMPHERAPGRIRR
jgi:hypothetical protein